MENGKREKVEEWRHEEQPAKEKRKETLERLCAFKNVFDMKINGEIWDLAHYALCSISLFKFCTKVILIFQTHRLQNKEQNPKKGQTATTKTLWGNLLRNQEFQSEDILWRIGDDKHKNQVQTPTG